jgi:hypothetical protein
VQRGFAHDLNGYALAHLDAWVPALFPAARKSNQGWRVSSRSLGRNLEEDISFTRDGIVDFGVADVGDSNLGKRTGANFAAPPRSRIISGYYLP